MEEGLGAGTLLSGRYRLDAEAGRGGMGVVYRAHDTLLERDVAVKVLTGPGLGTEGRARLLAEARAAARLNHPNIVSIYDAGQAELGEGQAPDVTRGQAPDVTRGQAPDSPDLADLLHETARACYFNGLPEEAASLCRQALDLAERFGDVRVQTEALTTLGTLGELDAGRGLAPLTRAIELAEPAGLLPQASRAHNNLAIDLFYGRGDVRSARLHLLRAADLDRQRGAVAEELFGRSNAVSMAVLLGELALAEAELASLRPVLETIPDPGAAAINLAACEALLRRYRGELEPAAQQLAFVRDAARSAGDLQMLNETLQYQVDLLLELGREAEARLALEGVLALSKQGLGGGFSTRCRMVGYLAQQGQIEAARQLLAEARSGREDPSPSSVNGLSLARAQAALAAAEGRWGEATAAYAALADQLERAGMRPLHALLLAEWAAAQRRRGQAGDDERARELLRRAVDELEVIGAPSYAWQMRKRMG